MKRCAAYAVAAVAGCAGRSTTYGGEDHAGGVGNNRGVSGSAGLGESGGRGGSAATAGAGSGETGTGAESGEGGRGLIAGSGPDAGSGGVAGANGMNPCNPSGRYSGSDCETPRVLLIHDGMPDLVESILRSANIDVTVAEIETQYDAALTPPDEFCAVVHLNGLTYETPMPVQGQEALRAYVVDHGGGFVGTAWNGFEAPTMTSMRDLILIPHALGHDGQRSYELTVAGSSHPVTAGLPSVFDFSAGFSEGRCPTTSTVLATEVGYQDAVCIANVGAGRVVDFNHAGSYRYRDDTQYQTWQNVNVQKLLVQGVTWACRR